MNGDIGTRPELADYLRRVRAGLADLPPDELAEVMEDVEPHVTEVFGEADSAEEVTARLGTPEDYAAELRAAGGYPQADAVPTGDKPRLWRARYLLWTTALITVVAALTGVATVEGHEGERYAPLFLCVLLGLPGLWLVFAGIVRHADVEALPEYRKGREWAVRAVGSLRPSVVAHLESMRPAWGLVRLVLLTLGILAAVAEGRDVYGMLAVLALTGVVVWCAGRVRADRRLLLLLVPANAFVVGLGIALAVDAVSDDDRTDYYYSSPYSSGLVYDGEHLGNVYAVDAQGRPIDEFYLYDQQGRPLNVRQERCPEPTSGRMVDQEYRNRFPVPVQVYDERGRCVERTSLPFVPLPPAVSISPTGVSPSAPTSGPPSGTTTVPPTASSVPSTTASVSPPVTPTK